MADLLGVVKQMMQPDRHTDAIRILARLTAFFRDRDNEFLLTRFACYEAIGVAIGEAGNVQAADHLIEDILYWKFQYPDIRGATDEWETVVNPYHLPKIRCWMHIIESNPALFERLAAALNVQLKLGGVFIADTDLFQRDVTRFLDADIRPIYFVAKQLLRTLPVYFNEVGAEGELRAVSTQIDEICGRRDTLMHFLRKQVHAESSNRMVPFSREVLRYWLTLDPAGLEPYVSANTLAAVRDERDVGRGTARGARRARRRSRRRRGRRGARRAARAHAGRARGAPRASGQDGDGARAHARPPSRGAASRSSCARTSCSRASTRWPPTTSAPPSRTTSTSTARRGTASRSRWPAGRRARAGAPGTRCSTRRSPCSSSSRPSSSAPAAAVGDREHLPEAAHRRRHPVHLRQLQRAAVRRAGSVVPRREPRRPAARRRRRRGHRAVRDARVPAPHGRRPCGASSARSPWTASTRARSTPTSTCSRPASRCATSPSASTRTCSSSCPTASPSCRRRPSSATSRCCTQCSSTTRGSARRAGCPSTPSPSWCCARSSSRGSACRRSTATCRRRCARSRCSTAVSTVAASRA